MNRLMMVLLRGYKRWISPLLPPACRFTPTCSEYALLSYQQYGFFRATWMSIWRICRCHPFHPGGIDYP